MTLSRTHPLILWFPLVALEKSPLLFALIGHDMVNCALPKKKKEKKKVNPLVRICCNGICLKAVSIVLSCILLLFSQNNNGIAEPPYGLNHSGHLACAIWLKTVKEHVTLPLRQFSRHFSQAEQQSSGLMPCHHAGKKIGRLIDRERQAEDQGRLKSH